MTTTDDVLDRIDTLTQRKRVFVARTNFVPPGQNVDMPEDEDIPVLTEVVQIAIASAEETSIPAAPIEPLIDSISHDLTERLRERIGAEIPGLVREATDRLVIELQQTILKVTEDCLNEYSAQRKQTHLELD